MKNIKILFFFAIVTITLLSCSNKQTYIDPVFSEISSLYGAQISTSIGFEISTNDQKKNVITVTVDGSEVINQESYNINFAGSLIPLLVYRNLTELGINSNSHIEVIIIQHNSKTQQEHTFEYSISDIRIINNCFNTLTNYITKESELAVNDLTKYFNLNKLPETDVIHLVNKLKNLKTDYGELSLMQVLGFQLVELDVNNEKGVVFWNYREYNENSILLDFYFPFKEDEYKIIGVNAQ